MGTQEPVLKQIQAIKEHLRNPLWTLMHDFRCLQAEEKALLEEVSAAVKVSHMLRKPEATSSEATWPQLLGETLVLLLPLWKLTALAVAKGQDQLMRFITTPPLSAGLGTQRLLQRLIETLLSEHANLDDVFADTTLCWASEPTPAELLSSTEVVDFLLPDAANREEFVRFRCAGLARVQQNIAQLRPPINSLPKDRRLTLQEEWRKVIDNVHLYLQLYLRVIEVFLEVQQEVKGFVHQNLFIEVTLGLPKMQWAIYDSPFGGG